LYASHRRKVHLEEPAEELFRRFELGLSISVVLQKWEDFAWHIGQFYEHDGVLPDGLVGFIGGGLKAGESAIVIATAEHRKTLDERLQVSNVDVAMARSRDQYITLAGRRSSRSIHGKPVA
jgi:hypothetical protein